MGNANLMLRGGGISEGKRVGRGDYRAKYLSHLR